ncbi:MAG: hypothetical protein MPJ50_03400 [Pirellulales bacterium]|nr:hypothetical protein [Pirellulales bacterium]
MEATSSTARTQWGSLSRSKPLAHPPIRTEFEQFRHQMTSFFAPQSVESSVIGDPVISNSVRTPKLKTVSSDSPAGMPA